MVVGRWCTIGVHQLCVGGTPIMPWHDMAKGTTPSVDHRRCHSTVQTVACGMSVPHLCTSTGHKRHRQWATDSAKQSQFMQQCPTSETLVFDDGLRGTVGGPSTTCGWGNDGALIGRMHRQCSTVCTLVGHQWCHDPCVALSVAHR